MHTPAKGAGLNSRASGVRIPPSPPGTRNPADRKVCGIFLSSGNEVVCIIGTPREKKEGADQFISSLNTKSFDQC